MEKVVCKHGADLTLDFKIKKSPNGWCEQVVQKMCRQCLREIDASDVLAAMLCVEIDARAE